MSQINNQPKKFPYVELATAPRSAGVYAWYASLSIYASDLDEFERTLAKLNNNRVDAMKYVETTLDNLFLKKYREDEFQITLRGALKPKYEGEAKHVPLASAGLIERLIEDPTRLRVIADAINTAAPFFTAPLYIGMAKNLRERLMRHKNTIDSMYDSLKSVSAPDLKDGDAGFARQVVARGFNPTSLFVYIHEIDVRTNEQVDIESILNRINFPIFGRN